MRTPLKTIGFSLRTNLFGFAIGRLDYAIPFDRPGVGGLWTFSLGPAYYGARRGAAGSRERRKPPTAP